jgi:hypothetical protein
VIYYIHKNIKQCYILNVARIWGGRRKRSTRKSYRKNHSNTLRIREGGFDWSLGKLFNTKEYQEKVKAAQQQAQLQAQQLQAQQLQAQQLQQEQTRRINRESYPADLKRQEEQQQEFLESILDEERRNFLIKLNPLFEEAEIVMMTNVAHTLKLDAEYLHQKIWPLYKTLLLSGIDINKIDKIGLWKWSRFYDSYALSLNDLKQETKKSDNDILADKNLQITAVRYFLYYLRH